jgi:hypothetical protein
MFGKVDGRAMGYGQSYYYSYIKEPLTFDFSQSPREWVRPKK